VERDFKQCPSVCLCVCLSVCRQLHMWGLYETIKPSMWKFRTVLGAWKSITKCSIVMSSQIQDGLRPLIWKSLCRHISIMMKFGTLGDFTFWLSLWLSLFGRDQTLIWALNFGLSPGRIFAHYYVCLRLQCPVYAKKWSSFGSAEVKL